MKPHIKLNLAFSKSHSYFKWTWTLHHPTYVNRKQVEKHKLIGLIKSKFVLSLILYKTVSIFFINWLIARISLLLCQQGVGGVLFYRIQRKVKLGRMVIVIVVTPLNLYKTELGATFIWIDLQISEIFTPIPPFFSSNPLLNKFMIRACWTRWSHDRKFSSKRLVLTFESCFTGTFTDSDDLMVSCLWRQRYSGWCGRFQTYQSKLHLRYMLPTFSYFNKVICIRGMWLAIFHGNI